MANYKKNSDDDIDDINKKANYLENIKKNSTQYVMAANLFYNFFISFLIAKNCVLLNKASIAQNFIFDRYVRIIFWDNMPNTGITKVIIAKKS